MHLSNMYLTWSHVMFSFLILPLTDGHPCTDEYFDKYDIDVEVIRSSEMSSFAPDTPLPLKNALAISNTKECETWSDILLFIPDPKAAENKVFLLTHSFVLCMSFIQVGLFQSASLQKKHIFFLIDKLICFVCDTLHWDCKSGFSLFK